MPLLTTKLYIPQNPGDFLSRPRLLERLNQGLSHKLTLISAPAGFGKTTLAGDWVACLHTSQSNGKLSDQRARVAWLVLDENDNDPIRFLTYLVAALQRVEPTIGQSTLKQLASSQSLIIESLMTVLINDLAALFDQAEAGSDLPNLVLILDDYHLVETETIHQAIIFLLNNMPPQLRLIIASRTDPPLSLARLRARRQLTEIRESDLRFTVEEAAILLNQMMELALSGEDIHALEARTEGWIAGLQLAAISLQDRSDVAGFINAFTGSHQFILDYLAEEVIDRQPEAIQRFLLQTAILNRLNGPLCDAVTGRDDSQAMLEHLARANLFIVSLDDQRHWYRYHQLFADLLRHYLKQAPPAFQPRLVEELKRTGTAALHRRAAVWHEQEDLIEEAVEHALAAQDFEQVGRLIEQNFRKLFSLRKVTLLLSWLQALPPTFLDQSLQLRMIWAWSLFIQGDLGQSKSQLQLVEQNLGKTSDSEATLNKIKGQRNVLRGEMALAQGQVDQAIALFQRALSHFPKEEPDFQQFISLQLAKAYRLNGEFERSNQFLSTADEVSNPGEFSTVVQLANLAEQYQFHGQLKQAIAVNRQVLTRLQQGVTPGFIGFKMTTLIRLSELLYEQNELEEALTQANIGLKLADETSDRRLSVTGRIILARIHQAHGNPQQALDLMDQAIQLIQGSELRSLHKRATSRRVRVWLAQGKSAAANEWLAQEQITVDDPFDSQDSFIYVTLARLLITQEKFETALCLLDSLRQSAEHLEQRQEITETLILQSLIYQAQDDLDQACQYLKPALNLGLAEGYIRCFIDEGAPLAALLLRFSEVYQQQTETSVRLQRYVSKLLSLFGITTPALPEPHNGQSTQPQVESLTKRELEVLQLMAQGLSNRNIAENLIVAESTLKSHVKNIYNKLEARNRLQALAKAKELNLL